MRRFFCDREGCERPEEIAAWARKTARLKEAVLAIAFEQGGEAGASLARGLGLLVSPDALLDRLRHTAGSAAAAVTVLGVDYFAFRKGNAYGTILVDLERRLVVDLLPECSRKSLADWLRLHPGVEVAARDRSRVYREALTDFFCDRLSAGGSGNLLYNGRVGSVTGRWFGRLARVGAPAGLRRLQHLAFE